MRRSRSSMELIVPVLKRYTHVDVAKLAAKLG